MAQTNTENHSNAEEEQTKIKILSKLFNSFKISFQSINVEELEFFDIYEIKLAPGTRTSKIDKILSDIGLNLMAKSVPIGRPIIQLGIYRLEVQTKELLNKSFAELYNHNPKHFAPVTLGVDFKGNPFQIDLHSLPNLLVAGVPGSGKSMLLHTIILSLIMINADMYLIDPKKVEFNFYRDLSNLKGLASSMDSAKVLLTKVSEIMDMRFRTLTKAGVANVLEYNAEHEDNFKPIAIVIDEWADYTLQDKSIHKQLCYLAQKGRAAGISIVLCTQRPSVNIISGVIKANFTGRICLKVNSGTDSRVILDQNGGEKILNVAEGLYLDQGNATPILFKVTYIQDLQMVINTICKKTTLEPAPSMWQKIWKFLTKMFAF